MYDVLTQEGIDSVFDDREGRFPGVAERREMLRGLLDFYRRAASVRFDPLFADDEVLGDRRFKRAFG
jgi:hypothetical protein